MSGNVSGATQSNVRYQNSTKKQTQKPSSSKNGEVTKDKKEHTDQLKNAVENRGMKQEKQVTAGETETSQLKSPEEILLAHKAQPAQSGEAGPSVAGRQSQTGVEFVNTELPIDELVVAEKIAPELLTAMNNSSRSGSVSVGKQAPMSSAEQTLMSAAREIQIAVSDGKSPGVVMSFQNTPGLKDASFVFTSNPNGSITVNINAGSAAALSSPQNRQKLKELLNKNGIKSEVVTSTDTQTVSDKGGYIPVGSRQQSGQRGEEFAHG